MAQKPTVKVSRDTWQRLTERKEPGVSYNEIISGLLDEVESHGTDSPEGS